MINQPHRTLQSIDMLLQNPDAFQGIASDPLTYHKYLFAHANPIMNSDPSGYLTLSGVMTTSSIIGGLVGATVGGIRNGLEGAISGAIGGAIFAPVVTLGGVALGLGISFGAGISATAGLATSFALLTTGGFAYNTYELLTAQNDRDKLAAGVSMIFTVGFGAYGGVKFASLPKLPPNVKANVMGLFPNSKSNYGTLLSEVAAALRGERVVAREVTIQTKSGIRVRVDLVVRMLDGKLGFIESKNGPHAKLTPNQRAGYREMEYYGGTIRGTNGIAAGLNDGAPIPQGTIVQLETWNGASSF